MAAGLVKGLWIHSKSCIPASCISSVYRKYAKFRTIEDSFRNRTPTYDDEEKPEYDRSKPSWSSLEEKEKHFKERTRSRILLMNPDYSFVDGRPVPMGGNMKSRFDRQREFAEKIVRYNAEMDFAVERHAQMQRAAEEERRNILDSKLKPKGKALMTSDTNAKKETEEAEDINTIKEAKKSRDVKTKR